MITQRLWRGFGEMRRKTGLSKIAETPIHWRRT